MESWKQRIMRASSLDDLCEALNKMEDAFREDTVDTG